MSRCNKVFLGCCGRFLFFIFARSDAIQTYICCGTIFAALAIRCLVVLQSGGAEAVLYAFNRAIRVEDLDPQLLIGIIVDFENAFNEANRQRFLDIVRTRYSAIYPWTIYCYSVGAPLFAHQDIVLLTSLS